MNSLIFQILTIFSLFVSIFSEATSVAPAPFLRLSPHNKVIAMPEGDRFVMSCIPGFEINDPKYEISWSHSVHGPIERGTLKDYGRSVFVVGIKLMLMFKPIKRDDAGNWTCSAVDTDGELRSKTFTLEVFEPIKFKDSLVTIYVNETEELFLSCDPNGTPKPQIIWEFDGSTIKEDSDDFKIVEDGLLLKNVGRDLEGSYKCRARQITTTISNEAEKSFKVIVNYAPVILNKNATIYGMINTTVNLTCRAIGRPNPKFVWYHRVHRDKERHVITEHTDNDVENSTLTVSLESSHSFGKYNCKVSNDFGTARVYFHIHQGRLPEVPDTFRLLGKSTISFDIEIGAKHDELYPVLGYRFEFIPKKYSDGEDDEISWEGAKIHDVFNKTSEKTNVIIHGLERDSTYIVRAAARNILGLSEWTNVEEFSTLTSIDHEEQHQQKRQERTTLSPRIVTVPPTEAGVDQKCAASVVTTLTGLLIIYLLCNSSRHQH